MHIKGKTWFAAGPEVERALPLLSDGAFRLYFYLCLNASRSTGVISVRYKDVAQALQRSPRSIVTYFDELRDRGVCRVAPGANQHKCSEIEICPEFWPYVKDAKDEDLLQTQYVKRVQEHLAAHACVQCSFSEVDRVYAAQLMTSGISIEQVEHGIMLGCARKYVSLLNGNDSGPIRTFAYFRDLILEAGHEITPAGYWDYLRPQLVKLEQRWVSSQER
jgi:hypothetical protein